MRADNWLDIARDTIARRRCCGAAKVMSDGEATARVMQPQPFAAIDAS